MKTSPLHRLLLAGTVLLVLAATGCGQSTRSTASSNSMDQATADDIALQSAATLDNAALDVGGAATVAATASATAPVSPQWASAQAAQWDTTFTHGTLNVSASREFYDAQGNVLAGYGPTAVQMVWTSRVWGTAETPRDTLTVGRSASTSIRGISPLQDTLTVNGAALDTLVNRFRSLDGARMRWFYWRSLLSTADVKLLKSTLGTGAWPLSGTMTLTVNADRLRSNSVTDVEAHLAAQVTVTYNGTSQPDVVVNGTWHYKWNMLTGAIVRA